jgi:hypothetical protein
VSRNGCGSAVKGGGDALKDVHRSPFPRNVDQGRSTRCCGLG